MTTLIENGFSEKEATCFLALQELGPSSTSAIAARTGLKRPTVYLVLERLIARGCVSKISRDKTQEFRALSPVVLWEGIRSRCDSLELALPDFERLQCSALTKPEMSYFEGPKGMIRVMEDTLNAKSELLCWADVSSATSSALRSYYPEYIKKKVARKLWVRGIVSYDSVALDFKRRGRDELRELYLIPKKQFPFKNEINIYDDKVAILSHQDQIGIIIRNVNIAATQRSIFQFAFEYAKIVERNLLSEKDRRYLQVGG